MTPNPLKKRPFGATIRTLSDITNERHLFENPSFGSDGGDDDANSVRNTATNSALFDHRSFPQSSDRNGGSKSSQNHSKSSPITIQHIPSLPNAQRATAILRRIHSEFQRIIQSRGWNVLSITEMCCCGDGIDHSHFGHNSHTHNSDSNKHTTTTKAKTATLGKNPSKHRSRKIMPDNVLGYNLTSFSRGRNTPSNGKRNAIHLRLRRPRTHDFYSYEEIAGTMCHELAHCDVGPHNARFYKAMEEIEGQYAVFLAGGVVVDEGGFPMGGSGNVLGGGTGRRSGNGHGGGDDARRRAMEAAEARRSNNHGFGLTSSSSSALGRSVGYVLGGTTSKRPVDPKEAARIAAERRRLDSRYCLPCNEVIEILGEETSDEECDDEIRGDISSNSDIEVVEVPIAKNAANASNRGKKVDEETKEKARYDDGVVAIDLDESEDERKPPAKKKKIGTGMNGIGDVVNSTKVEKPAPTSSTASKPLVGCTSQVRASSRIKGAAESAKVSLSSKQAIDLTADTPDENESDRGSQLKPSILTRTKENPINHVHNNNSLSSFQPRGSLHPMKKHIHRAKESSSISMSTYAKTPSKSFATSLFNQQNSYHTNNHHSQLTATTLTGPSTSFMNEEWTCPRCTFNNPPIILVCDACHLERPCGAADPPIYSGMEEIIFETTVVSTENVDKRVLTASLTVKEKEVEESRKIFGGFNIYGDKKTPSGTMKHLT